MTFVCVTQFSTLPTEPAIMTGVNVDSHRFSTVKWEVPVLSQECSQQIHDDVNIRINFLITFKLSLHYLQGKHCFQLTNTMPQESYEYHYSFVIVFFSNYFTCTCTIVDRSWFSFESRQPNSPAVRLLSGSCKWSLSSCCVWPIVERRGATLTYDPSVFIQSCVETYSQLNRLPQSSFRRAATTPQPRSKRCILRGHNKSHCEEHKNFRAWVLHRVPESTF